MKEKMLIAASAFLVAAFIASPARGWQSSDQEHAVHHPDTQTTAPKATAPKATAPAAAQATLDELVKRMNAAQGQAKVDVMAELLTALVQTHQTMHADMGSMMQNMGGMHRK